MPQGEGSEEDAPLYVDALYKIHLDMHCPEWDDSILGNLDAHQIVSTVAKTGCRAMVVFAKDTYGNAYYNTQFGHKHRCIGKRDLLAELLAAGRRHHMAMAAYFCAIWDNRACEEHPEWRLRGPGGADLADTVTNPDGAKWRSVCHNSGFAGLAEHMIEEIALRYDLDAFHLDMFNMDFGGLSCYCDTCRSLFFEQTGKDIPETPTWDETWRQFLEFRYQSVERYMRRLRDAIHRHKPGLPIVMNYHGAPGFDWRVGQMPVRHSLPSDLGTGETYTPMLGDFYPGLDTRFVRDLVPGRRFEVVSWRMNRITDFTTKPREQLRWELFSSLCFGANVMLIDQPFHDGWLDEHPYGELRRIFAEIEAKRPYLGGTPQRYVGLYYSCRNRDWYGREDQARFLLPFMGAYRAMVESHIDVGFLFDETLDADALSAYPVVFLSNVAAMSETEAALFREYVRRGGNLIATLDTSLYSEFGIRRDNFLLADVFGVDYAGMLDCDACYLRGIAPPYGGDLDPRNFILTLGQARRTRTTTAQDVGDLHDSFHKKRMPDHFFSHSMHPPYTREMAAIHVNAYGQGRAVYIPCGLDAAYAGTHELAEHRILLRNIVHAFGHQPAVEVTAPLNVESSVMIQDHRILIHLLAFSPLRQPTTLPNLNTPIRPSLRMEEAPIYRGCINIHAPFSAVRAYNETTQHSVCGNRVTFQVEDVHEILIVDLA